MRAAAVGVLAFFLVAGCAGGDADEGAEDVRAAESVPREVGGRALEAPFAADGPLLGLVFASGVDDRGKPIDPAVQFAARAREVSAVVPLGELEGARLLTITWHRLVGSKREQLFEHRIRVESFQRAYSTAVARGRLPSGAYEVVAAFGDRELRSTWFAAQEPGVAASGAEAEPPAAGDSGVESWYDDPPPPATDADAATEGVSCSLSAGADWMGFVVTARALGHFDGCGQLLLGAKASGGWVRLGEGQRYVEESFHPCQLPGGSDLAGTVILVIAAQAEGDGEDLAEVTLPDPELPPAVDVNSDPPPASTVSAGDTIEVWAHALQLPHGPGIRSVELSGPNGARIAREEYETKECDPRRYVKLVRATYRVPDSPPRTFEICGQAEDAAGRRGRDCSSYLTGEVWEGTWQAEHRTPAIVSRDTGTFRLVVSGNGAVSGSGTGTQVTEGSTGRYKLTIGGTRDDDAFRLKWGGPGGTIDVTAPIQGATARGAWRVGSGGVFYRGTTTLRCVTCASG